VDVQGVATDGIGAAGDKFRYHIADALVGASWNATGSPAEGTFASITGPQTLTFNGNKSLTTCGYLIIQHRDAAAATVEITSIKVTYGYVSVDVAGTPQNVVVEAGGSSAANAADVSLIAGGYETSFVGGYGNSYAIFEVNFGTDTLANFQKIEFDFVGVSGDVGWKDIRVFAYNEGAKKTNYLDSSVATDRIVNYNYSTDGLTSMSVSATISGASGITSNKVWFIITIHADATPVFDVTNIKFVK